MPHKPLLTVYSLSHALVDFSCAFLVYRKLCDPFFNRRIYFKMLPSLPCFFKFPRKIYEYKCHSRSRAEQTDPGSCSRCCAQILYRNNIV